MIFNWLLLSLLFVDVAINLVLVARRSSTDKGYVRTVNGIGIWTVLMGTWLYLSVHGHFAFTTVDVIVTGGSLGQLAAFQHIQHQRRQSERLHQVLLSRIARMEHYFKTRDERREVAKWN